MKISFVLPLAAFTLIAAVFAYLLLSGHDSTRIPSVLIDEPAPDFDLPRLATDGDRFVNQDLAGDVAVVNFFASWCVPCRAEHPLLTRLAEEKGVPVFGVNYKDKPEHAKAWLANLGNPYEEIGVDDAGRTAIDWGVYGLPETFVIDGTGRIRYKHVGPLMPSDIDKVILPIVRDLRS